MDHVLDVGRCSQPITRDDKPPYALFNKVGMLGLALPILVNYTSNHTFCNQRARNVMGLHYKQLGGPIY